MCFSLCRKKLHTIYASRFPQFHPQQIINLYLWMQESTWQRAVYCSKNWKKFQLILFLFGSWYIFYLIYKLYLCIPSIVHGSAWEDWFYCLRDCWIQWSCMHHIYCNKWNSLDWNLKTHTSKDLTSSSIQSCWIEELKEAGIPFSLLLHSQMYSLLEEFNTMILFPTDQTKSWYGTEESPQWYHEGDHGVPVFKM